ncbi:hypothetical protein GOY07_00355 [Wolbachia endosymbiont of Litomosoides sigmodontis]|nr:hypothetical protein [Wolbachia endosymbiont of Litomosoides sigmodontis]QKX02711.1 hypothetical protein GOY07_00355 [Wolbachia endosymbiont of Litomosoides sigmodontis]
MKSTKEMLKEVRNNAYVQKTKCCNCSKKHSITYIVKTCFISRMALTIQIKYLKYGREEKLFATS